MKKIYIAGKVTGLPQEEVIAKFDDLQMNLERCGFKVINPIKVVGDWNASWETAMRKCIKALVDCDAVYLMDCHTQSPGARIEHELAQNLRIPCVTNVFQLADI